MSENRVDAIAVLGAGGHAKVVIATLQAAGFTVAAVFDDDAAKQGSALLGVEVQGTLAEFANSSYRHAVIAVGSNATRMRLAERLQNQLQNIEWVIAVHPQTYVHSSVKLGAGTVVFAGAVVQPDAVVGAHAIINTGATIDHDCLIGDFVHIAPGTHLAGEVRIDRGAFIGIGAAVIPSRKVGEWATVGAGAMVVNDIPARATAVGVPARVLSREAR
jgi:sugar O-acyltransferase (sialic acid O-acetyltransferase NeuD family)